MKTIYDAIVVGCGAMGSATLYQLARRGRKVLGLERYDIPHEMGSSHGVTRIIRLAYYEHASYVPLLRRAYQLWRELEQASGEKLLYVTGSIDAGLPESRVIRGSIESCETHQLRHEILTSTELSQRFPGFQLPAEYMAVFQPDGGFLLPERCIVCSIRLAQEHGAEVHAREPVLHWQPCGAGVEVRTSQGTYQAERLVLAAGAWIAKLEPALNRLVSPERQVLAWFQPLSPELFRPERFPVFNLLVEEGRYYGLPVFSVPGLKVGRYHHREELVDPDTMDRQCHASDETILRDFVSLYFPQGSGPTMALRPCIFTNTRDERFILDLHPKYPQVAIASPCSGHGFKFASVVGEIMADLTEYGESGHDLSGHRLKRLQDSTAN